MSSGSTVKPKLLLKDSAFIAVDKPAGMPSQPDPTGDPDLLSVLKDMVAEPDIGLVHRLDRPVSGVVLFATTKSTLIQFNEQFRDRTVRKVYWAIVEGILASRTVLQNAITHDPRTKKARIGSTDDSVSKDARIVVDPLAAGDRYTLVQVVPEGGAFHQIRVQLSAAGHPIKGDVKYGARRGEKDRSIALHARSIEFDHPITHERTKVVAEVPELPLWKALVELMDAPDP